MASREYKTINKSQKSYYKNLERKQRVVNWDHARLFHLLLQPYSLVDFRRVRICHSNRRETHLYWIFQICQKYKHHLKFYFTLALCQSVWYQSLVCLDQSSDQWCLYRCFITCTMYGTMYGSTSIKNTKIRRYHSTIE